MARPNITSLSGSNTFKNWLDKTNDIITEVNFLNSTGITGITGVNGIGITNDGDRNYTIRFTGNVTTAVTFANNVTIQGALSANSINVSTTKLSYSPKISGLTAGKVVRIHATEGLTYAKADTSENAEVLGILIGEDASYNYVAVTGQIDNSAFADTITNICGTTLQKGTAYFLSPTVAGGITTIEPSAYGQVSKPVILGISGDKGLILPHRGIIIEGITAGITAELDNKIIIQIDYTNLPAGFTNGSNLASPSAIKIGDPIFYASNGTQIGSTDLGSTPLQVLGNLIDRGRYKTPTDDRSYGWAGVKIAGLDVSGDVAYWIIDWADIKNSHDNYGIQLNDNSGLYRYFLSNVTVENKGILGLVSNIVATPASLGQSKYILEVTLPGGSFKVNNFSTDLDTALYPVVTTSWPYDGGGSKTIGLSAGSYMWAPRSISGALPNPYTNSLDDYTFGWYKLWPIASLDNSIDINDSVELYKFLDIVKESPTSGKIVFHYQTQRQVVSERNDSFTNITPAFTGSGSGTTGSGVNYNYLPNGSFSVWQRTFAGYSGATYGSLGYEKIIPVADRWSFINNDNLAGLTLTLQRQQFDSTQTNVPGSPLYYVDIKTQYTIPVDAEEKPRLENIQKDARLLQGQTATISFYAKSNVAGSTLDLTFNRYDDGIQTDGSAINNAFYLRQQIVTGITLTTSWKNYSYPFVVPVMGSTLAPEQNGWIAFGFEFPNSSATVSLAQVRLYSGSNSAVPVYVDPIEELERCKPYYQRSYDLDEAARSTNSRGNEESVFLGNLNAQIKYPVKFTKEMIETPYSVTVFSPVTGTPTEAYNVNAGQDLKYTTGTLVNYPWDTSPRYRSGAGLTGNTTIPEKSKYGFNLQINSGAVSLDTIKFHWISDADFIFRP